MKKGWLMAGLATCLVVGALYAQPLNVVSSKEGTGTYFPKGFVFPQSNGKELLMLLQSLHGSMGDVTDATLLGENMEVKGEKLPFRLWDAKGGMALAKNIFIGDFYTSRAIFCTREVGPKVDFGYTTYSNDLLAAPTFHVLYSYKVSNNSQDPFIFENNYLFGGSISADRKKVGTAHFPDGNKGSTETASTFTVSCHDISGKEDWSKTMELPNEQKFRIRVMDCKTDNEGNVYVLLNYLRFSSPNYVSKGIYVLMAGPGFGKVEIRPINFNRPIVTVDHKTWVDEKKGYYIMGYGYEKVGEGQSDLFYYAPLAEEGPIEVTYLDNKSSKFPNIDHMIPASVENTFPNRALSLIETNGVYPVDATHFLVLAAAPGRDYTAFLLDKEGKITEYVNLAYRGAACREELKTPFIKKIGDNICVFYQGTAGQTSVYTGSKSNLPDTEPDMFSASLFMQDIKLTNMVGKYVVFKDGKFSGEYVLPGTEGYGMPSHVFESEGKTRFLFNKNNGKKSVAYKWMEVE